MKIMLFGTKILLPADGEYSGESCLESRNGGGDRCSDVQEKQVDQEDHHQEEEEHLPKPEKEESNPSTALKKPEKILPCPRCNSPDTKFCYYNNYNISQPRHFCKGCQRYWTDGGTMRNVPVGAGRRKSKNYLASHHRSQNIYQHPFIPFPYPLQSYYTPWQSPTQTQKVVISSALGKHSRIGELLKTEEGS